MGKIRCSGSGQYSIAIYSRSSSQRKLGILVRVDGKAVAMAKSARKTATHIAVNGVYTLPEYRQRGYAAAVVAHICKLILNDGKIPLLYTDLANTCSDKAYTNVGFVPCGKVDEVHLKWK